MPAALPFVMWAAGGSFAANAFLFVFKLVTYAAVGLALSKAFGKKPSGALNQGSPLQLTKDPTPIRRVIYGETRVSGPLIYAALSGTKNEFLHLVLPLATHECAALGLVLFNEITIPIDDETGAATGDLAGFARVKKHLGAEDQAADADLVAESGGAWTTDDRIAGSAYLYLRLKWDQNKYPGGIPNPTCVVKGRKVYDPRTEVSAWSDNVALCVRDYLTSAIYGLGVTDAEIDEASFIAAANICDEEVTLAGGGTEKRYTCNGAFELSAEPGTVLEKLAGAMAGWVVYVGGKWICHAGAYVTPTITLNEDDLRAPLTVQTKLSLRDTCNLVKGTFTSPVEQYQPADFPAVSSSTYLEEDQGVQIVRDLELHFTTSPSMAQRLARLDLQRTRRDLTLTMPCKLTALRVRAGSTVMVTNARYGWSAKAFLVVGHKFITYGEGSLGVDLVLRETDSTIYSWSTDDESPYEPGEETSLDWRSVPTPSDVALSTANIIQADGVVTPRLKVQWTAAANQFVLAGGSVQIEYKRTADETWLVLADSLRGDATTAYLTDVKGGESIDVRLRFTNSLRLDGAYSAVETATVSLDVTAPDAPGDAAATTALGGVTVSWTENAEDDLDHYRIFRRLAAEDNDIAGATLVWSGRATSWTDFDVTVGVGYRYWLRAVDTSGNISAAASPVTASADPALDVEYSIDGSTAWHFPFADGDKYMRQRLSGGSWSAAIKIIGEDGDTGPAGAPGTVPQATAADITSLSSPSLRVSSPSGAESGWYAVYTVGGGSTQYVATQFPIDINMGSASAKLWITGRAPGYTDSPVTEVSWNDLNE